MPKIRAFSSGFDDAVTKSTWLRFFLWPLCEMVWLPEGEKKFEDVITRFDTVIRT